MTDHDFTPPPARDLPPGRLQQRHAHLVRELSGTHARRRLRPMLLLPAVALVGAGSAWAAGVFDSHPIHATDVQCYAAASLSARHTPAAMAEIGVPSARSPGELCAPFFARGYLSDGGTTVPRLASCTGGGVVRVFPVDREGVCDRLGLTALPDSRYRAEISRSVRMFQTAQRALVEARGGTISFDANGFGGLESSSSGPSGEVCLSPPAARAVVRRALDKAGLPDVKIADGPGLRPATCVEDAEGDPGFDGNTITLVARQTGTAVPATPSPQERADRARACRAPKTAIDLLDAYECEVSGPGFPRCATPERFRAAARAARARGPFADWDIVVTGGRGPGRTTFAAGERADGRIRVLTIDLATTACPR